MKRSNANRFLAALVALCLAVMLAVPAFAEDTSSGGTGSTGSGAGVTVDGGAYYGLDYLQFTLKGAAGQKVFYDLDYNGTPRAKYALAQLDASGSFAIGQDVADGEEADQYALTVYGPDRTQIATGTVAYAYADLYDAAGTAGAIRKIGVCTAGSNGTNEAFAPNATYYDADTKTDYDYSKPGQGGHFIYVEHTAAALTGSVSYVDAAGAVLKTDTYTVTESAPASYTVLSQFDASGVTYVPVNSADAGKAITANYTDPSIDHVILCRELKNAADGAYRAIIRMVDAADPAKVLMSDTVSVTKAYAYSAPGSFCRSSSTSATLYTLADAGLASIALAPGDSGVDPVTLTKVITVPYTAQDNTKAVDWLIYKMDGSTNTQIGEPEKISVKPGETKTYTAAALTVNGTSYQPASGSTYTYTYGGANLIQYVYYVPAGYVPAAAYAVTVQYKNIADGSVLFTQQVNAAPGADTLITSPAQYSANGQNYVRLDGQEDTLRHSF
jgi:hypothetical protein